MDKPALVSLTFDDGFRSQFDAALPILKDYGFLATFFLIANREATHEHWDGHIDEWWKIDWCDDDVSMLKALHKDGYEIGSHSLTHHDRTMRKQPEKEASESKSFIEGQIGAKIDSFCYPFYRTHSYLLNPVKSAGYRQARGGNRASQYAIGQGFALDRFNVDCREVSRNENVNGWVRPGHWHVLTYHGIGGKKDGWMPIEVVQFSMQMAELARLRDSEAVEVVTFKDGAERVSSPI